MDQGLFTKMRVEVFVSPERYIQGVVMPDQTHSAHVQQITKGDEDLSDCDALITSNTHLTLGIHTRDCAPICFADGEKIAIAHVGWPGLCKGLIEEVMTNFDPDRTEVFVGPHLQTFEIKRDFCYDAIAAKCGEQFITTEHEMLTFHFKDAIASCLPVQTIFDPRNTAHDTILPSYRHKRMLGHIITSVHFKTV